MVDEIIDIQENEDAGALPYATLEDAIPEASVSGTATVLTFSEEELSDSVGLTFSVDYEASATQRINLAVAMIQRYQALSGIDDDAAGLLAQWQTYYKALKVLRDQGEFEAGYELPTPE